MYKLTDILEKVEKQSGSAFFYTPYKDESSQSFFFGKPSKIICINSADELEKKLTEIDNFIKEEGLTGYALAAYEFGYLLEEKFENFLSEEYDFDLLKFYFFEKSEVKVVESKDIDFSGVSDRITTANYSVTNFDLNTSKEKYINDIEKVKNYIAKGDTYQVNYTVKGKFDFRGNYPDLFLNLLFNQSAEFCSFINDGEDFIISVSPELFFINKALSIETRPMKGTIKRGINEFKDEQLKNHLFESEKDRAENVMIVDLLRNDLGKISKFNSVYVKSLFDIEKYESLFQMTSTVCSELQENSLNKILRQIFPCGSITGAPKIRTMEIIKELEIEPRGIYTGSIGIISEEKNSFNVAIRTLRIKKGTGKGEIGIGSGVVWDSVPESEYEETLLKGSFLTYPQQYFEVFESILFENESYYLLAYHIERIKKAARHFLFRFDEKKILEKLEELKNSFTQGKRYKVKLILDKWGNLKTEAVELEEKNYSGKAFLSKTKMDKNNKFLYFKTTERETYNSEFQKFSSKGYDEVIYLNKQNEITEGSFTNIFIEKNEQLYTPPIESGLLDGCLRKHLLETGKCLEKKLFFEDLQSADKLFIGNSVRGLIEIKYIET